MTRGMHINKQASAADHCVKHCNEHALDGGKQLWVLAQPFHDSFWARSEERPCLLAVDVSEICECVCEHFTLLAAARVMCVISLCLNDMR